MRHIGKRIFPFLAVLFLALALLPVSALAAAPQTAPPGDALVLTSAQTQAQHTDELVAEPLESADDLTADGKAMRNAWSVMLAVLSVVLLVALAWTIFLQLTKRDPDEGSGKPHGVK